MTIYDKLKEYLTIQPKARLRCNKNRAIGNLIIKDHMLSIDKNKMSMIVGEVLSADRAWRKVLEENPSLRGSDYDEKIRLSQEKQIELGYESGYNENVRLLDKI